MLRTAGLDQGICLGDLIIAYVGKRAGNDASHPLPQRQEAALDWLSGCFRPVRRTLQLARFRFCEGPPKSRIHEFSGLGRIVADRRAASNARASAAAGANFCNSSRRGPSHFRAMRTTG
jgi:hypothetical protein